MMMQKPIYNCDPRCCNPKAEGHQCLRCGYCGRTFDEWGLLRYVSTKRRGRGKR